MTRLVLALALVMAAFGCATNPVTGQEELRLIDASQEVQMGQQIDKEVRSQYQVVTGTPAAERVARTGQRIAAVSDRKDIPYHFALIESNDINAFAAPGGYIYVTTALERLASSDAELAAVMAHEVGHVAAGHSVQQLQEAMGYQLLRDLVLGGESQAAVAAADIAFNNIIMTGFSRQDEYQSDEIGVRYAAAAGYDPYGEADFFAKLIQVQGEGRLNKNFEFLMSHPNLEARQQRAEALASRYAGGPRAR